MSYSLIKHQQELVDKLGNPNISARLIGDEMLLRVPEKLTSALLSKTV